MRRDMRLFRVEKPASGGDIWEKMKGGPAG